jgi:flagellar basal body-associated protein FliL
MPDTIADAVNSAVAGVSDQPESVKAAAAAAAAAAAVPPPTGSTVGALWIILVVGLVLALLGALGGVFWAVTDGKSTTSPDVALTVFSSVLTGLIGLFVTSPTGGRR